LVKNELSNSGGALHRLLVSGVMTPRPVVVKYQLPDGRTVDGGRRFVICFDCDAITEAEMLPSLGDIELEERSTAPNLFTRLLSWLPYTIGSQRSRMAICKRRAIS
jgi:hypothetical protein